MKRTMVADALAATETPQSILVQGWVRTRRDSKAGLSFIQINDGSCFDSIQIVAPGTLDNFASVVQKLSAGCSISCTGTLVESQGKGQSVEIQADAIELVGDVEDPDTYPISPKHHSFEYLRTVQHLRVRTNTFGAVARVRNRLAQAIHQFFDERRFLWVHTPIITAADAEGAGEMFRVSTLDLLNAPRTPDGDVDFDQDFFGKESFLTVSGQLNVETYCCALSNVYTFGPTFRAENSHTARHLAEFWMIEPEIAFGDLSANIDLAVDMVKHVLRVALEECAGDMKFFNERIEKGIIDALEHVIESDFVRMTYTDAVNEIGKSSKKFEYPVKWGDNLQTEHERYLCEEVHKKPVVVTDYPKDIKAFYMRLNDDEKTVAAMDVLVPRIGELIGGSQREERLSHLDARLDAMKMEKEHFGWYRDLRRYGTVPHAGFGLGFERLVMYVTGMANMRDVIPFPRAPRLAEY